MNGITEQEMDLQERAARDTIRNRTEDAYTVEPETMLALIHTVRSAVRTLDEVTAERDRLRGVVQRLQAETENIDQYHDREQDYLARIAALEARVAGRQEPEPGTVRVGSPEETVEVVVSSDAGGGTDPRAGTVIGEYEAIDHRALLAKYLDHVRDAEGIDFVDYVNERHRSSVVFTPAEVAELRTLAGKSPEVPARPPFNLADELVERRLVVALYRMIRGAREEVTARIPYVIGSTLAPPPDGADGFVVLDATEAGEPQPLLWNSFDHRAFPGQVLVLEDLRKIVRLESV